jgi:Putative beta-lactamase-inhibitor-like, PepSY-like
MNTRRQMASAGGRLAFVVAGLLCLAPVSRAQDKDKLDLDKIPKKVMDALKAKFPMPEITKWTKEKEGADEVFDIEFKLKGRKYEADIKEDGTIVNYEKEIAIKDLPKAVTKAVQAKYPKSTFKEVMEMTDVNGKNETLHGYEITLETADRKSIEVTVAPDGKILEDSGAAKKTEKQ